MSPRIVVAAQIHAPVQALLHRHGAVVVNDSSEPWSAGDLRSQCQQTDALMAFMTERIDAEFLDACPDLKLVAGALKGYNNFDVDACTSRGVAVTIVPDLLTEPTAELTVGLMIGLIRNVPAGDRWVRSGHFSGWRPTLYGGSLAGATVGLLGAGAVGQATLRMLSGFNCRLLYHDPKRLDDEQERALNATYAEQDELITESDILVLAIHLMPSTRHLVDAEFIRRMKPGAYLVNPSRGSVVRESDVANALETGQLAGYAADTFESEDWEYPDRPKVVDARLLQSDRTIFTPHIGSGVRSVRQAIEMEAAENIIDMLEGRPPRGIVNPEVL